MLRGFLVLILFLSVISSIVLGQVAVNDSGTAPHPSAALDISATNKGFLAPRMNEVQRLAIVSPPQGLMVYQSNASIGYWYFDLNQGGWNQLMRGPQPWTSLGNAGIDPSTQFLGTTNNQPLVFATNGSEVARFENNGRFRLGGTSAPSQVMHIEGGIKQTGTSNGDTQGSVRWNALRNFHEGNTDGTANGWYPLENVFVEKDPADWYELVASCSTPPSGYVQIGAGTGTTVGTLESPYGTNWEDHKVQLLYLASELMAANLCPNEDITAVAFNATSAGTWPMQRANLGMTQTTTADMQSGLEPGITNLWSSQSHIHAGGWNQYTFNAPFQWNGTSNLIVEYSFDNCEWSSNRHIFTDATQHHALYGIYCDACGGNGPNTCIVNSCPECPGLPCRCGVVGGNDLDNNTNLITCTNCAFPGGTVGSKAAVKKRAQIRFYGLTGQSIINSYQDKLIFYNGGLMIGDATWASGSIGGLPSLPANYRGPGTIHAQGAVWGGNNQLNDHVFDLYFDGSTRLEDSSFIAPGPIIRLADFSTFTREHHHLPNLPGRAEWQKKGRSSIDEINNGLWLTVEHQAIYIRELNERLHALQDFLLERQLKDKNP